MSLVVRAAVTRRRQSLCSHARLAQIPHRSIRLSDRFSRNRRIRGHAAPPSSSTNLLKLAGRDHRAVDVVKPEALDVFLQLNERVGFIIILFCTPRITSCDLLADLVFNLPRDLRQVTAGVLALQAREPGFKRLSIMPRQRYIIPV